MTENKTIAEKYPECDCFPTNSNRYAICTGEANKPLETINSYRVRWGFDPLPDDGRERPKHVVHRKGVTNKPRKRDPLRHHQTNCIGCSSNDRDRELVSEVTMGPGSELLYIYDSLGIPSCPACREMAARMDRLGITYCSNNIESLVNEILPRARGWADHLKLGVGKIIPDGVLRWRIKRDLKKAIELAKQPPEWKSLDLKSVISQTEIVVKSFQRLDFLRNFINSVRQLYPTLQIRVVDDSGQYVDQGVVEEIKSTPNLTWMDMPYDTGLPAGRNYGVSASTAKYIILCDDDYIFTEDTRLELLMIGLLKAKLDICGGLVQWEGKAYPQNWTGMFSFKGQGSRRWLQMSRNPTKYERHLGVRVQRSNVTYNFFVARKEFLTEHPWDERYKITNEHIDSFVTWWQAGAKVGFTPDVICLNDSRKPSIGYRIKRKRNQSGEFLEKWNIYQRKTISPVQFKVQREVVP